MDRKVQNMLFLQLSNKFGFLVELTKYTCLFHSNYEPKYKHLIYQQSKLYFS